MHLRVVSPTDRTGAMLTALAAVPNVVNLVVHRGSGAQPGGRPRDARRAERARQPRDRAAARPWGRPGRFDHRRAQRDDPVGGGVTRGGRRAGCVVGGGGVVGGRGTLARRRRADRELRADDGAVDAHRRGRHPHRLADPGDRGDGDRPRVRPADRRGARRVPPPARARPDGAAHPGGRPRPRRRGRARRSRRSSA